MPCACREREHSHVYACLPDFLLLFQHLELFRRVDCGCRGRHVVGWPGGVEGVTAAVACHCAALPRVRVWLRAWPILMSYSPQKISGMFDDLIFSRFLFSYSKTTVAQDRCSVSASVSASVSHHHLCSTGSTTSGLSIICPPFKVGLWVWQTNQDWTMSVTDLPRLDSECDRPTKVGLWVWQTNQGWTMSVTDLPRLDSECDRPTKVGLWVWQTNQGWTMSVTDQPRLDSECDRPTKVGQWVWQTNQG